MVNVCLMGFLIAPFPDHCLLVPFHIFRTSILECMLAAVSNIRTICVRSQSVSVMIDICYLNNIQYESCANIITEINTDAF